MSMTKIQQVIVGAGGASSIDFNSIPQTFTDLMILTSIRKSDAANYYGFAFNGSAANTSSLMFIGTGSITGSFSYSASNKYNIFGYPTSSNDTASTYGSGQIYILDYKSANAKSISLNSVSENNATGAIQQIKTGLWNSSAAVTSISIAAVNDSLDTSGTFAAGSSATLYGINRTQAIGKPKAIGGNITFANGHWFHTFTGSGTFVAQEDLAVDALVVAGGGAGGSYYGGGGGAGGISYKASIPMAKNASAGILVGSGGSGAGATPVPGANGNNSQFGNIISNGGGGGGNWVSSVVVLGRAGGSGGGGPMGVSQGNTAAGGSSNQTSTDGALAFGNAGGTGYRGVSNSFRGGGGGGAGAVGQSTPINDSFSPGSNGGVGLNTWSSWAQATSTGHNGFYGGGGGGGVTSGTPGQGGAGGGGAGDAGGGNPVAGMASTGGGGGADTASGLGAAAGGSGVVIIRYPAE